MNSNADHDKVNQDKNERLARLVKRQGEKRHLAAIWAAHATIAPCMVVLDVGAGVGALTLGYAQHVGHSGMVFALEPDTECLAHALTEAERMRLPVSGLGYHAAALELLPRTPDRVMLTDTLHHADDAPGMLAAIRRVMTPRSILFLAEYDPSGPGLVGAKPAQRLAPAKVLALLEQAGFAPTTPQAAPDEHYWLTATLK